MLQRRTEGISCLLPRALGKQNLPSPQTIHQTSSPKHSPNNFVFLVLYTFHNPKLPKHPLPHFTMDSDPNDSTNDGNITNGNPTNGSSVCPSLAVSSPQKRSGEPLGGVQKKTSRVALRSKTQSAVSQNGADGHPTLPVPVEDQGSNEGEADASSATNGADGQTPTPPLSVGDQGSNRSESDTSSEVRGISSRTSVYNGPGIVNAPPAAAEKDQEPAACNGSADSEFLHHICCQPQSNSFAGGMPRIVDSTFTAIGKACRMAECGTFNFDVTHRAVDEKISFDKVQDQVSTIVKELKDRFDRLEGDGNHFLATPLGASQRRPQGKEPTWEAKARVRVTLAVKENGDFKDPSAFAVDVLKMEGVSIAGVNWQVNDKTSTELHTEARKYAHSNAWSMAFQYAENVYRVSKDAIQPVSCDERPYYTYAGIDCCPPPKDPSVPGSNAGPYETAGPITTEFFFCPEKVQVSVNVNFKFQFDLSKRLVDADKKEDAVMSGTD